MITNWKIENFKSISDEKWFEFAPLTVLCGANSSGKSTLIQSLLLITQTIKYAVPSKAILLNGSILKCGSYNDIVFNSEFNRKISFGFKLSPTSEEFLNSGLSAALLNALKPKDGNLKDIFVDFRLQPTLSSIQPSLDEMSIQLEYENVADLKKEQLRVRFTDESLEKKKSRLKIDSIPLPSDDSNALQYEILGDKIYMKSSASYQLPFSGEYCGVIFKNFLPDSLEVLYEETGDSASKTLDMISGFSINESLYKNFHIPLPLKNRLLDLMADLENDLSTDKTASNLRPHRLKFLDQLKNNFSAADWNNYGAYLQNQKITATQILSSKRNELLNLARDNKPDSYNLQSVQLSPPLDIASRFSKAFFSSMVKYLGPLREEPKPLYPLPGGNDPKDIGYKGELTAAVLNLYQNEQVRYISPESLLGLKRELSLRRNNLKQAVQDWMSYMGIGSSILPTDEGKLGHRLTIKTDMDDIEHDLTHVGVGVSQILPILVLSLLADQGSILIFEQPELHLHPKVQSRLADFFFSMTLLGKQCIIETHSEYLINRLRLLIAQSQDENLASKAIIYFTEKEGLNSRYTPIKINRFGTILNWPKGFFDESIDNASEIINASMARKLRENEQK